MVRKGMTRIPMVANIVSRSGQPSAQILISKATKYMVCHQN